jgi:hypothetical protein
MIDAGEECIRIVEGRILSLGETKVSVWGAMLG